MMDPLTESDARFLAAFEACDIPAGEFGHREHVRLAYIYLQLHAVDEALARIRAGLEKLLAHLGAPASAYHETVTRAWLLAVRHFMDRTGPTVDFEEFIAKGGARLLEKEIMGTHYSAGLLKSELARRQFVAPDLEPIPEHVA